jgi:hypothetical protein
LHDLQNLRQNDDFGCFDMQTRHSESSPGTFPFRTNFTLSWVRK